jgi:uncharacterized membrane protein
VRISAALALCALAELWLVAIWLWPGLPERIPMHFDLAGTPDREVERTLLNWFLLPGFGTALGLLFAFALPAWIRGLAARNSPHLNVPRKRDFAALSPEARVRAVAPMLVMLRLVAAEVALLFGLVLLGCARVASGAWQTMPALLLWPAVVVLLATALGSLPFGVAAVKRELASTRD